jgi:hypothetical protein
MDNQRFQKLQKSLTPETQVIFWISEQALDQKPAYFEELDYFFNQLLSELVLHQSQSTRDSHFMMGEHFGSPLYLLHSSADQAQKHIDSMLKLLPKEVSSRALSIGPAKKLQLPKQFQVTQL